MYEEIFFADLGNICQRWRSVVFVKQSMQVCLPTWNHSSLVCLMRNQKWKVELGTDANLKVIEENYRFAERRKHLNLLLVRIISRDTAEKILHFRLCPAKSHWKRIPGDLIGKCVAFFFFLHRAHVRWIFMIGSQWRILCWRRKIASRYPANNVPFAVTE